MGRFLLKRQLLVAALAVAASPAAFAQLPGGLGDGHILRGIEGSIDRTIDTTIDRTLTDATTGRIEPAAEKLVQAKDLPKTVLDPLLKIPLLAVPKEVTVEDNWRAIDHEWIALLQPDQIPALQAANVNIISQRPLSATGLVLVRVVVSDQDNTSARAEALLRSLGATAADRNHIYDARNGNAPEAPSPSPAPLEGGGKGVTLGLIDTALVRKHPALSRANITERDFVESSSARPTAHGTAIASLLVGNERDHRGLIPDAHLVAASVFHASSNDSTGATTSALIAALDWMSSQGVTVVNMSLAGPPNQVLGAFIDTLSKRGMIIVAAVGNDGPSARPLYPAAFDPVVAVTAVDKRNNIYRWANQGPQVDFAAWGVKTDVAMPKGGYGEASGTSFAAPIVSAAIAEQVASSGGSSSAAVQALIAKAEDLGAKGRDDTYGYGLVKPASWR